jgi:hypothetical protein
MLFCNEKGRVVRTFYSIWTVEFLGSFLYDLGEFTKTFDRHRIRPDSLFVELDSTHVSVLVGMFGAIQDYFE